MTRIVVRAALALIVLGTAVVLIACPVLIFVFGADNAVLVALLVAAGCLMVVFVALVPVWLWMTIDWMNLMRTDPETAKPYLFWMILGWPFPYYFNHYEKRRSL